ALFVRDKPLTELGSLSSFRNSAKYYLQAEAHSFQPLRTNFLFVTHCQIDTVHYYSTIHCFSKTEKQESHMVIPVYADSFASFAYFVPLVPKNIS
ncbi:hypothetical protein, partial [Faecalibaculum rodentium]|uniref:hypothetical protein n=1 Tax=Faecalibaculum rodentium TaxID=1702221 RepID=UPI00255AF1FE